MCRTYNSTMPIKGQCLNWRSWVWALHFLSAPYLPNSWKDFHQTLVLFADPITQPCRRKVKVIIEGHVIDPWILCPLHISFTTERILIQLWSNVRLGEIMCKPIRQPCRLNVKVTIVHEFGPWILYPLHISFVLGRIFLFNFDKSFASRWDDVQNP